MRRRSPVRRAVAAAQGVLAAATGFLALALPWAPAGAQPQPQPAWSLSSNMVVLAPSNRFTTALVVTNPADRPLYVRTAVHALAVEDGRRQRRPETAGALRIYPAEFVVRPGGAVTVRLLADAGRLDGPGNQSFYATLTDVSRTVASGEDGGVAQGISLAYDVLVSVNRQPAARLPADAFTLAGGDGGASRPLRLSNRSGQHVMLNGGYRCADDQQALKDCQAIPAFPRQSMLPGETLDIPDVQAPFLGLWLFPSLDTTGRSQALFIPRPPAVPAAG